MLSTFNTLSGAIDLAAAYRGELSVPAEDYWLPGLPPGVVVGLIGATGTGKSWIALQHIEHLARSLSQAKPRGDEAGGGLRPAWRGFSSQYG